MAEPSVSVDLELLPLPALLAHDGLIVSTNREYRDIVGLSPDQLNGHSSMEIIQRTVHPADLILFSVAAGRDLTVESRGQLWCRILDPLGRERPMRVEWRTGEDPQDIFVFLIEAQPEAYGKQVTDTLARTSGALSQCATEDQLLGSAADNLAEQGFTVSVLLIDGVSPLLKYGPQRIAVGLRSEAGADRSWADFRPPRQLLEQINPHFMQRRAAFFQDGVRLVREAYPERIADDLARRLPSTHMVQAPLFVEDRPYGALVVTGATLTPLVATALELYAELVGHALANVRLRRERVERERLAALGEASAVMAHEVRNPVGAILNAVAIARRAPAGDPMQAEMIKVIAEEAGRLEQLVDQLLEVGRPLAPRPRLTTLDELVSTSLALLVSRQECVAGRVGVRREEAPTPVLLDPDLSSLALLNVLRNAIQSTPKSGAIQVSIEHRTSLSGIVVEDGGPPCVRVVVASAGDIRRQQKPRGRAPSRTWSTAGSSSRGW